MFYYFAFIVNFIFFFLCFGNKFISNDNNKKKKIVVIYVFKISRFNFTQYFTYIFTSFTNVDRGVYHETSMYVLNHCTLKSFQLKEEIQY